MEGQEHDMVMIIEVKQRDSHKRAGDQIKWSSTFLSCQSSDLILQVGFREVLEIMAANGQILLRHYRLSRLTVNRFECCPKVFMPLQNLVEAALKNVLID